MLESVLKEPINPYLTLTSQINALNAQLENSVQLKDWPLLKVIAMLDSSVHNVPKKELLQL